MTRRRKPSGRWPIVLNVTIKPLAERHAVTAMVFSLAVGLLLMARETPDLWEVELFKTLLTAVIITGILNMVLPFHYASNKRDEDKTDNTAKAFEAITRVADGASGKPGEETKQ